MKNFISIISFLSTAFLFSGCNSGIVASIDPFSNIGGTYHNKDLVLRDVALPQDFVILEDSFCHGTQTFRYGEFLMRGELSVEDVFFYYKKQMPANYWTEVTAQSFETSARMIFQKNDDKCTILCKEGKQLTELKIIVEQKKS